MESVVFFLLVSHSQLREALAITATPGPRSFCGHFLHHTRPTLGWEELFWAKNKRFVPPVLYNGCAVFLVGDIKALDR